MRPEVRIAPKSVLLLCLILPVAFALSVQYAVSGCDVENMICTNACGGIFSDRPTGWSYSTDQCESGSYHVHTDSYFNSVLSGSSGDCAQFWGSYPNLVCPSYSRKLASVSRTDCFCTSANESEFNCSTNFTNSWPFNFSNVYFAGTVTTLPACNMPITKNCSLSSNMSCTMSTAVCIWNSGTCTPLNPCGEYTVFGE